MRRQLTILAALLVCVTGSARAQSHSKKAVLAPGPFAPISGARLGTPVTFENEIDHHACLPLVVGGRTVAWLSRAYAVANLLLVRRCTFYSPSESGPVTKGNRAGAANQFWERASADVRGRVRFSRLSLPRWSFLSNPAFCDSYVAYWGWTLKDATNLTPSIYSLVASAQVVSRTVKSDDEFETDNEEYLPPPAWDASCSTASFDGRSSRKVTLIWW